MLGQLLRDVVDARLQFQRIQALQGRLLEARGWKSWPSALDVMNHLRDHILIDPILEGLGHDG